MRYVLRPAGGGVLPSFEPGAHVVLHLPLGDGAVVARSYSLLNAPEPGRAVPSYDIGVLLHPRSRGGSSHLHAHVRAGSIVECEPPRNAFALVPHAGAHVLVAGGIGITPLLCMAERLAREHADAVLHYFCHDAEQAAFLADLEALPGVAVHTHFGLSRDDIERRLAGIAMRTPGISNFYVCGPAGFIDAMRRHAADAGHAPSYVHFERFEAAATEDAGAFEVRLDVSGLTLRVPPHQSLLDALLAAGAAVRADCRAGNCGACLVTVQQGEIDHRDDFLLDEDRAEGRLMCACVSRSKSPLLVLQL
ncbi:PDR/VanB family oxidoreductase [Variovorax sp. KK3]|uniref:PDR/VanB family oxidoreductase n=1 Tax=Variovorax sp. KK3 TaxID=1855728 RepID=UPI0015C369A4|nr:PDR/VanB family oxidoreductase [Variovorax sp. KK3]